MKADEIVEVVAEAIIDASFGQELPEAPRDLARAALAAAYPLIARRVLEEAAEMVRAKDHRTDLVKHDDPHAIGWKHALDEVERRLRDRAAALASEVLCADPCCAHESTHNGLGLAGGDCTDCMNTGHTHATTGGE